MENLNQDTREKVYHGNTGIWRFKSVGETLAELIFGKPVPKCHICKNPVVVVKDDTGRSLCSSHSEKE